MSHIFNQASYNEAKEIAKEVIDKFQSLLPDAMEVLSDGLEDSLQFYHFDDLPQGRISSTNQFGEVEQGDPQAV